MEEEEGIMQFLLCSEEWTGKREMPVWGSGKSFTQAPGDLPRLSHTTWRQKPCTFPAPTPEVWPVSLHIGQHCGQLVPLLELGIVLTDIHRRPPGGGVSAPGPSARLPGREFQGPGYSLSGKILFGLN